MNLDNEVQAALRAWADAAVGIADALCGAPGAEWVSARANYDGVMADLFPAPNEVPFSDVTLDGVRAALGCPHDGCGRTLLYIHGGGYASGAPRGYLGLAGRLAHLLGAEVLIPDYRLAPEHRFPAAIDDVVASYRALIREGRDPRSIVIAGDSAGGAMVVTLMRKARDAGLPLPAAGYAMSPWANLAHTGSSIRTRAGLDPACTLDYLSLLARNFLGDALPTDPDASPVYSDVRGLPPILVQIGENEIMLSDSIRLAAHLAENRVRVSLEVWPGMFHVWHLLSGRMAQADEALRNGVAFLDAALTPRSATPGP
jgi:acetyl esterase/lipase